jgi:hypothetical protein
MTRLNPRAEHGVTMIAVMIVLLVATMIASASLLAAQSDLPFARASQDRKQAYAAAEAGIEYYLYQLTQDNDYWTKCTGVPAPAPVNQTWNGVGVDPRIWRALPGSTAKYTIELLPNAVSSSCVAGSAESTMLDQTTGTFRIRATGRMGNKGTKADTTRSIVASMRRRSFLDFLYFTDFETLDPSAYATQAQRDWAVGACGSNKYRAARDSNCAEIQFVSADANRGPFHTNDDILACGNYTLGRKKSDRIEISGPAKWQTPSTNGSCDSGQPNVLGTVYNPVDQLTMPTTNSALADQALPAYTYSGRTTIYLHGNQMDVTDRNGVKTLNVPMPSNGVIYVKDLACPATSTPLLQNYDEAPGCANVTVYGSYSTNLTIGSAKDIIIGPEIDQATKRPKTSNGDLKKTGDVVLGLIANNFVRVEHSVSRTDLTDVDTCTNRTAISDNQPVDDITIEAAILSLQHSFIADNYACGAKLGTITVKGAIAQKYRGPVGIVGTHGFIKDYNYDDRLRYRSPPFFLDPVSAAWGVVRQNEQVPANG